MKLKKDEFFGGRMYLDTEKIFVYKLEGSILRIVILKIII